MILDNMLDDRQAEAGSACVARTGLVYAEEALEHPVDVCFGDADTLVGDRNLNHTLVAPDADADP